MCIGVSVWLGWGGIRVAGCVHSAASKGSVCFECVLHSEHNKCLRVPYEQLTASTVPISYRPSEEKTNIAQRREAMTHSPHCHSVEALHGEDVCVCLLCSTSW